MVNKVNLVCSVGAVLTSIYIYLATIIIGAQALVVYNPFPPSAPIWHRLAKLSILIFEGIIKNISYERHDCESVDEKSLS